MVFSRRQTAPPPKAALMHERVAASASSVVSAMVSSIPLAVALLLVVLASRLRRRSSVKPVIPDSGSVPDVNETPRTGSWCMDDGTWVNTNSARRVFQQLEQDLIREKSERVYASNSHQRILCELQQENNALRREAAAARKEAARIHRTLNGLLIAANCDAAYTRKLGSNQPPLGPAAHAHILATRPHQRDGLTPPCCIPLAGERLLGLHHASTIVIKTGSVPLRSVRSLQPWMIAPRALPACGKASVVSCDPI